MKCVVCICVCAQVVADLTVKSRELAGFGSLADTLTAVKDAYYAARAAGRARVEQGEYLTSVPLAAFRGLTDFMDVARTFWVGTLRQPDPGDLASRLESMLSASFVDYARGDGLAQRASCAAPDISSSCAQVM